MFSFDGVPPDEMEAICTPMHLILSPGPTSAGNTSTGALYLGSMAATNEPDLLSEHNITHFVQVLEVPWLPQAEDSAFKYHRIDLEDSASAALRPHLTEACDYIQKALQGGSNVLVHCHQGVSRSASIVIAYLIRERGMTYDAAFRLVKQKRCCVRPNSGFVQALREWEIACCTPALKTSSRSFP